MDAMLELWYGITSETDVDIRAEAPAVIAHLGEDTIVSEHDDEETGVITETHLGGWTAKYNYNDVELCNIPGCVYCNYPEYYA